MYKYLRLKSKKNLSRNRKNPHSNYFTLISVTITSKFRANFSLLLTLLILKKPENSSSNSARVIPKKRFSKVKSKVWKVDSNEKLRGSGRRQKLIYNLTLWRLKFIWNLKLSFPVKLLISVPLATAHLIGDVMTKRKSTKGNIIGGNNTSVPIGKADQIWRGIFNQVWFCGFFWVHLALITVFKK